jgi:hypothetical protein
LVDNTGFDGEIEWSPALAAGGTFEMGKFYTATVTLDAAIGYEFPTYADETAIAGFTLGSVAPTALISATSSTVKFTTEFDGIPVSKLNVADSIVTKADWDRIYDFTGVDWTQPLVRAGVLYTPRFSGLTGDTTNGELRIQTGGAILTFTAEVKGTISGGPTKVIFEDTASGTLNANGRILWNAYFESSVTGLPADSGLITLNNGNQSVPVVIGPNGAVISTAGTVNAIYSKNKVRVLNGGRVSSAGGVAILAASNVDSVIIGQSGDGSAAITAGGPFVIQALGEGTAIRVVNAALRMTAPSGPNTQAGTMAYWNNPPSPLISRINTAYITVPTTTDGTKGGIVISRATLTAVGAPQFMIIAGTGAEDYTNNREIIINGVTTAPEFTTSAIQLTSKDAASTSVINIIDSKLKASAATGWVVNAPSAVVRVFSLQDSSLVASTASAAGTTVGAVLADSVFVETRSNTAPFHAVVRVGQVGAAAANAGTGNAIRANAVSLRGYQRQSIVTAAGGTAIWAGDADVPASFAFQSTAKAGNVWVVSSDVASSLTSDNAVVYARGQVGVGAREGFINPSVRTLTTTGVSSATAIEAIGTVTVAGGTITGRKAGVVSNESVINVVGPPASRTGTLFANGAPLGEHTYSTAEPLPNGPGTGMNVVSLPTFTPATSPWVTQSALTVTADVTVLETKLSGSRITIDHQYANILTSAASTAASVTVKTAGGITFRSFEQILAQAGTAVLISATQAPGFVNSSVISGGKVIRSNSGTAIDARADLIVGSLSTVEASAIKVTSGATATGVALGTGANAGIPTLVPNAAIKVTGTNNIVYVRNAYIGYEVTAGTTAPNNSTTTAPALWLADGAKAEIGSPARLVASEGGTGGTTDPDGANVYSGVPPNTSTGVIAGDANNPTNRFARLATTQGVVIRVDGSIPTIDEQNAIASAYHRTTVPPVLVRDGEVYVTSGNAANSQGIYVNLATSFGKDADAANNNVVIISGGNVTAAGSAGGRGVHVRNFGNVLMNGGRIQALGGAGTGAGAAVATGIHTGTVAVNRTGHVSISGKSKITVNNGIGIRTVAGGRVNIGVAAGDTVTVEATSAAAATAALPTTAIRADRPSITGWMDGTSNLAGTITVGVETDPVGMINVTSAGGKAVVTTDTLFVWNRAVLNTDADTAVKAQRVYMGYKSQPLNGVPIIVPITNVAATAPPQITAGTAEGLISVPRTLGVFLTNGMRIGTGSVIAGRVNNSTLGEAYVTANGVVVTALAAAGATTTRDSVVIEGTGRIETFGQTLALKNENVNVQVAVRGTGAKSVWSLGNDALFVSVSSGNRGTAIESASRVDIGDRKSGDYTYVETPVVRVGNGGVGVSMTGTGMRTLAVHNGQVISGDGATSAVVNSGAGVVDSLYGGRLTVGEAGTVVKALGDVVVGDAWLVATGATGTGIDFTGNTTGALRFIISNNDDNTSEGRLISKDKGIVSTRPVMVTGTPALSGVIKANITVGSELANNAAVVSVARTLEGDGLDLIIDTTSTMTVRPGSTLITQGKEKDTLIVNGTLDLSMVSNVLPAPNFQNNGWFVIGRGGKVNFSSIPESFKNESEGMMVLSTGITLSRTQNNATVTTALTTPAQYLAWADTLTSGNSARAESGAEVIIPPVFDDVAEWGGSLATARDTVYTGSDFQLYLHEDSKDFRGDTTFTLVSGALPTGVREGNENQALFLHDSTGELRGLLTQVGTYRFRARVTNQAGFAEKDYTAIVTPTELEDKHVFAEVVSVNRGGRELSRDTITTDNNGVNAAYTGERVRVTNGGTVIDEYNRLRYTGFGVITLMYVGTGDTRYPRSNVPPTDAGTYEVQIVHATASGSNFTEVSANSPVTLGTITIDQSSLEDVIGLQNTIVDMLLPAGEALSEVKVALPNVRPLFAMYVDEGDITPDNTDMLVEGSVRIAGTSAGDSLVFSVNENSKWGDQMNFELQVTAGSRTNITESVVTVRILFVDELGLTELTPIVAINYAREAIDGFDATKGYSVSVGATTVEVRNTAELAIEAGWFGQTVAVTALPTGTFMIASVPAQVTIPTRPAAPAVTGDTATIRGTTTEMEYKLSTATTWTRAAAGNTTNLAAGQYNVRFRATDDAFVSEVANVTVRERPVSVAGTDREVPTTVEDVAAIAPVKVVAGQFTVGPNPSVKAEGKATFFWTGKALADGKLSVFDAQGNLVKVVSVSDKSAAGDAPRAIGVWNLTDKKSAPVSEGTYLVRGTLKAKDGTSVKVSYTLGVK